MNSTDSQLVAHTAAGDRRAFGEFYDRHAPQVLGLLLRLLRDRSEAEDTLQDTFWQVWRTAERFDPGRASPRVWLFLIARSRAMDRLRRRRRAEPPRPIEAAESADPRYDVERSESVGQVRAALERLPESQRSAICLAFYGGHSYEAVARQQGVPVGTIKTRIRLGMRHLRGLLRHEVEVTGS